MSSVGKGVAAASLCKLLQAHGRKVTAAKIDPYVNVDAGTMNPTEHGEVFVLDDGTECDQDMGNYERFLDVRLTKANYMTTGSVYLSVITKERNLGYKGQCVNVVPDIPLAVIERIREGAREAGADTVVVEIGGTVGDYQNVLFLEAVRILKFTNPNDVVLGLVSLVPGLGAGGNELKTKPTQHAVKNLNAIGLQPDFVLARAKVPLDDKRKEKLAFTCSLDPRGIISAPDVESIYDVPLNLEKEQLSTLVLSRLGLKPQKKPLLTEWKAFVRRVHSPTHVVRIAVVGKYFGTGSFVLHDSYISVIEAVKHAAAANRAAVQLDWVSSTEIEERGAARVLHRYAGVVVPGGFGSRGTEGMIKAIEYARTKKVPYLGLCYGMQMATIEFARNVAGLGGATTTEIDPQAKHPVIHIMPDQEKKLRNLDYGGSMRLGGWDCILEPGSKAYAAYARQGWLPKRGKSLIRERHRHRYEFNNEYRERLTKAGLRISGTSPDGSLVEMVELPSHPFFVASQFHPEFLSWPLRPHPLFCDFVKAAVHHA